ncbi:MAG: hypothetical protein D6689_13585 [Deltaproteobacteria bacterium]|nr:MAG: hypothetical protein D6689_13585 [Deltaproteobacteria bacterium]
MDRRWHPVLGAIAAVAALILGAQFEYTRTLEARVLALLAPVAAVAAAGVAVVDCERRWIAATVPVLVAAAVVAVWTIGVTVTPRHPIASVDVARAGGDRDIDAPPDGRPFDVQVHAGLERRSGSARGTFTLELRRAGAVRALRGAVERAVRRGRRVRRFGPMTSMFLHETERFRTSLPGNGPARVRVVAADGAVLPTLHVAILPPPWGESAVPLALGVVAVLGLVVDVAARRSRVHVHAFPPVAFAAVFAFELARDLNVDDPLPSVLGVGLLAGLAAAAAWAIAAVAGALVRSERPAAVGSASDAGALAPAARTDRRDPSG